MHATPAAWVSASLTILAAAIVGVVVARWADRRLHRNLALSRLQLDLLFAASLRPLLAWWFLTLGLFLAKLQLAEDLDPRIGRIVDVVLLTLLVGSVTIALARLAGDGVKLYALRSRGIRRSSSLFVTLARFTIGLLGVLVLLQALGVPVTPVLGALGVGGIAVALALQPTLSNVFAGIQLLASGTVRPGDFVSYQGCEGTVEDVNWRYTTIRLLPNNLTVVPNAVLSETPFTNHQLPSPQMSVVVPARVTFDADLERVEQIAVEAAVEAMRAQPDGPPEAAEPFVRYRAFGPDGIELDVIVHVRTFVDQYLVRHELIKQLQRRFAAEGIEIPEPRRVIRLDEPGAARTAPEPENGSRSPLAWARASSGSRRRGG